MTNHLHLGASLYVPSVRPNLLAIATREKYPFLRSVIFCTEDGICPDDLNLGLANLRRLLGELGERAPLSEDSSRSPLLRFVRVRNPSVLEQLLRMPGVEHLDGFVLPKVTLENIDAYLHILDEHPPFSLMPTLETIEVFDPGAMRELRDRLADEPCRSRILSLRIGGNDLLNLLGVRRPAGGTIYETPLHSTISQLVTIWRPHGFNLTGPVCDLLEDKPLLTRETQQDLATGLFGKTAIHPRQVAVIESAYRVRQDELDLAGQILGQASPAVYRYNSTMCEPVTQQRWARATLERAQLFGIAGVTPETPTRNGRIRSVNGTR